MTMKENDGLEDLDPNLHMIYSEMYGVGVVISNDGKTVSVGGRCYNIYERSKDLNHLRAMKFYRVKKPSQWERE